MDELLCPVCGQANPPEAETCSNCGASLHAPLQPGQPPVKKHTSELEPILPDWLRDAREKSRQTGENEIPEPPKKDTHPFGVGDDLLAGLNAQSQDDEADIPDWLANVTGARGVKKEPSEPTGPRRVELDDFGEPEPPSPPPSGSASDPLDWLSNLSKSEPQKPPEEDLKDWFRQAAEPASPPAQVPPSLPPEKSDLDWLTRLKAGTSTPSESGTSESGLPSWLAGEAGTPPPESPSEGTGTPDWLKDLGPAPGVPDAVGSAASFSEEANISDWSTGEASETPASADDLAPAELPDWLKDLRDVSNLSDEDQIQPLPPSSAAWLPEENQASSAAPSLPGESSVEDAGNFAWLREMREEAAPEELGKPVPAFDESAIPLHENTGELDWLKAMETSQPSASQDELPTPALTDEPTWFTQASTESPAHLDAKTLPVSPLDDIELPDWLKGAAPEAPVTPAEQVELPDWMKPASLEAAAPEPPSTSAEGLPGWLSTPAPGSPGEVAPEPTEPTGIPGWLSSLPTLQETTPEETGELPLPALPPAELPSGGLDSLFTPMPDWLSEAPSTSSPEPASAPIQSSAGPEEALTPANLPSWVQAMRPVEASAPASVQGEETMETQGPLAGLHGILPSLPYLGPAQRPQAQSMKLNASTEQQNHGALLEQVLQSEVHPDPVPVARRMSLQKGLRLAIGLLLFLVLLAGVAAGTQIIPLPVGWSAEAVAAVQAVESIPAGSPVLVVFDYEPALAGEMEAIAAPLLDHIIIRSHPVLTLLSTSPTGSALADRIFAGPLSSLAYQDRINLGYLPGGLGGVRSFVQNPAAAMPLGSDSTPVLAGVRPFSEYSAILVITDSLEGGRTWIEQAGPPWYAGKAFVVVSSAQAGPMLQPYYNSGQINGLVSGLFDAAVLEQNNAGRPGLARHYWDAYNLGLILTALLITLGALWSLIASLRDRPSGEAE